MLTTVAFTHAGFLLRKNINGCFPGQMNFSLTTLRVYRKDRYLAVIGQLLRMTGFE